MVLTLHEMSFHENYGLQSRRLAQTEVHPQWRPAKRRYDAHSRPGIDTALLVLTCKVSELFMFPRVSKGTYITSTTHLTLPSSWSRKAGTVWPPGWNLHLRPAEPAELPTKGPLTTRVSGPAGHTAISGCAIPGQPQTKPLWICVIESLAPKPRRVQPVRYSVSGSPLVDKDDCTSHWIIILSNDHDHNIAPPMRLKIGVNGFGRIGTIYYQLPADPAMPEPWSRIEFTAYFSCRQTSCQGVAREPSRLWACSY